MTPDTRGIIRNQIIFKGNKPYAYKFERMNGRQRQSIIKITTSSLQFLSWINEILAIVSSTDMPAMFVDEKYLI